MTARGSATFLSTGVERSAPLWEIAPDAAAEAIARHDALIAEAVAAYGGTLAGERSGDGAVRAVFASAGAAVAAALAIQRAFASQRWPAGLPVRIRVGVATGASAAPHGQGAPGMEVAADRAGRVRDVAHPGQTLLAGSTAALVAEALPDGAELVDLGMHRLRDLTTEQLLELRHRDLPGDFPKVRSLDVLPNNLPAQLTSFVGRETELEQVAGLLSGQRLVTLTGAGGCGKTRLALRAAAERAEDWPDGVWWVDLGAVTDPTLVAKLTAATLHLLVEGVADPLPALAAQLRDRRLLVCLDTCEHLLDACAELAETFLRACPGVTVLATSREPLGVPGETVWRVPSLVEGEAVRLFADRAALVRPGFDIADHQEPVQTVCRRLDGMPLAVELAAAWVRALPPAQIAAMLDDRLKLLAGGQRGVVARHRTLAASIDWSHDLLENTDRVVFRRLAVFSGGFTLEAARAVCTQALDDVGGQDVLLALGRLVDKSLVVAGEADGQARYRLLDTVREYAAQRLEAAGETAATRDRHLDFFLAFAEAAESALDQDQDRWRRVLEGEHDNLRAALRWGLAADDPERGRRLAAALAMLWFLHGHTREGSRLLDQAVQRAAEDRSRLQGRLLVGRGLMAMASGRPPEAVEAARQALDIADAAGDGQLRARCLMLLGYGVFYHDFPAALEFGRQARSAGELAGDRFATGFGQMIEGMVLHEQDRHPEALAVARPAFEQAMARLDRFNAAFTRLCEAYCVLFTGDVRRADALAEESVAIARPLGDYFIIGNIISNVAWFKCVTGDLESGRRLVEPIAQSMEDAGLVDVSWMAFALGRLHLCGGDLEGAATWYARGTRFATPTTDNRLVCRALVGLAGALRRLGRDQAARGHVDRAAAIARKLGCHHPLSDALEETAFLTAADDPAGAEDLHHQALAIRVDHGLRPFCADSIDALAGLAARAGRLDPAVRLLAASDRARAVMGYPRAAIDQPDADTTLSAARETLGEDAFQAAWAEGSTLSLEEAVAYARRARGSRDRPATGWGSLTPTEQEVVGLVVEGLTNPEIGARLFMSRATVKTHLSHIYAKLGVANRTELATLAGSRSGRQPPATPS